MNIYERIKALRIKNGMSQYDLALKVGYEGRSAISKVEQGKRDISQSMIVKYAEALGVTPAYLLYGDEENPSTEMAEGEDILAAFNSLSPEKQKQFRDYLRFLATSPEN